MKNPLLATLVCLPYLIFSQVSVDTSTLNGYVSFDHFFENLNEDSIPHGFLMSKSPCFLPFDNYQGDNLNDSNKVNRMLFELGYASLSNISTSNNNSLPDPSSNIHSITATPDSIPINCLFYRYSQIKDYALDSNLLAVIDTQLFDVPGRQENPYFEKEIFLASPWNYDTLVGDTMYFYLPSFGIISNDSSSIIKLEVDFKNGNGWNEITAGQGFFVYFTSSGEKIFDYKLILNNGDTLYSHSSFEFKYDINYGNKPAGGQPYDFSSRFPITGIPGASVTGLSHCGDNNLYKPLIIIEGFNTPAIPGFNTTFPIYFREDDVLSLGRSWPSTGRRIRDEYAWSEYDLVYVDFNDGTASLQSNVEVVKNEIASYSKINTSGLNPGVYMVKTVNTESGNTRQGKFTIH